MIIRKNLLAIVAVAAVVTLGLTSCESWLDYNETEEPQISYLTRDAEFEAKSVIAKHFTGGIYSDGKNHENFFLEFVGANRSGVQDVLILDLLAPEGHTDLAGEYTVGYAGDFVALSMYTVLDQTTGIYYTGGSYYGEAKNNYITDYYGFLTEGKVTITLLEEGVYNVVVDAKSELPTIKMTYTGAIEFKKPGEGSKPEEEEKTE